MFSHPDRSAFVHAEPLIFERSVPGRTGHSLPQAFGDEGSAFAGIPEDLQRHKPAELPEVDEPTVIRHFTRLSLWNHSIDKGMYPLGSCTMKYNPRINETVARFAGFNQLHPYVPESLCQGALELMWELAEFLQEISGFARVTLAPAAGAHGEFTGVKMIRAYHKAQGNPRKRILIRTRPMAPTRPPARCVATRSRRSRRAPTAFCCPRPWPRPWTRRWPASC